MVPAPESPFQDNVIQWEVIQTEDGEAEEVSRNRGMESGLEGRPQECGSGSWVPSVPDLREYTAQCLSLHSMACILIGRLTQRAWSHLICYCMHHTPFLLQPHTIPVALTATAYLE